MFSRNIKLPCEDQGDILKPFKSFVCICEFIQSYISNFITAIQELFEERTIPFTMWSLNQEDLNVWGLPNIE